MRLLINQPKENNKELCKVSEQSGGREEVWK